MKKKLAIILAAMMLVLLVSAAAPAEKDTDTPTLVLRFKPDDSGMLKTGNMALDIPADDFLKVFDLGDVVTVSMPEYESLDMPVCASFEDVSAGEMLLRAKSGKDVVQMALNEGNMGMMLGLLEEAPANSEMTLIPKPNADLDIDVTVTLKEKGGWLDRLQLSKLVRPNNITDYAVAMTDAQFANFRSITTNGMGKGILYRSSSPIRPKIGRNTYADRCTAAAGIRTIVNLADTEAEAMAFEGYSETYYSRKNIIFLGLPAAIGTERFREGLAEGLRFIIANEGPYLVHCNEGKDRAGFTAAVLELLMGASLQEVCDDYLITYENFFAPLVDGGVQLNDELCHTIRNIMISNLNYAFGIENITETDPHQATIDYFTKIGLSSNEIESLSERLSVNINH